MNTSNTIKAALLTSLATANPGDVIAKAMHLGQDTPRRASIAFDILSKALDTTKLVRVQRPVNRKGKTYMKHMWVSPAQVKKGDTVIGNKQVYEDYLKSADEAAAPTAVAEKQGTKTAAKKNAGMFAKMKAHQDKKKAAATPKTETKPKPETKPKAETKPKPEAKPKTETKPKPETKPKTEAKPKPEVKPKADIFSDGAVSEEHIRKVYSAARLEETDPLSSEESYKAALRGLQQIKRRQDMAAQNADEHSEYTGVPIKQCIGAVYKQREVALHGKKATEEKITQTYENILKQVGDGISGLNGNDPAYVAATLDAWQSGKDIRKRYDTFTITRGPLSNEYTDTLKDLVKIGNPQEQTLYCATAITKSHLQSMLETQTGAVVGIQSAFADPDVAQKEAKEYRRYDSVNVVYELPASEARKTLDIGGPAHETLIQDLAKSTVESITKDADGVYHIKLSAGEANTDKPIADRDIYSTFGVKRPPDPGKDPAKMTPEERRKMMDEARFDHPEIQGSYRDMLKSRFDQGDEQARLAYDMYVGAGTGIRDAHYVPASANGATAFYTTSENAVYLNVEKDTNGFTFYHEHGHMVDTQSNFGHTSCQPQYQYEAALKHDFQELWKECKKEGIEKWRAEIRAIIEKDPKYKEWWFKTHKDPSKEKPPRDLQEALAFGVLEDRMRAEMPEDYQDTLLNVRRGVDDIISGVTKNRHKAYTRWSHRTSYWKNPDALPVEAFANMYEATFDPVKASVMQKCFPTAWKAFRQMLTDITA